MVTDASPIVIHARARWIERLLAACLGRRAVGMRELARSLTETDLERVPALELAEAEEHNDFMLERERATPEWRRSFSAASWHGVDAQRLEAICCQHFILAHGRHASQLRHLLRIRDPQTLRVATDLPLALVDALYAEKHWQPERLAVMAGVSALLRTLSFIDDMATLFVINSKAVVRLLQMLRATPPAARGPYAAWLGAGSPEMASVGAEAMSLPEFLHDALAAAAVPEIVIQGARPSALLPPGLRWQPGRFVSRFRPRAAAFARALASQVLLLANAVLRSADWRRRQLLAPVLSALPGTRLWLETDPPAAVLYPNSMIGGEPLVAALGARYGVRTMMVFYSSNVAYPVPPSRARLPTDLEPEMRYIAADRLAMWSPEMAEAFAAAGYCRTRLPVTGVVHYGRQGALRRRVAASPARIGVFDVSSQKPERRFLTGWGQTLYHSLFCRRFFEDLTAAAQERWGKRFVVVRKLKRELDPSVHAADVDLAACLPVEHLEPAPSNANLWHLLATVDIVICMPFTSVALMAERYGIPAAYYDPLGSARRSSLAGRAPLLSGREALARWLADPVPAPAHDASINVAAQTLNAALGLPWQAPRLAG